jgi:small GTP-binding protein
MAAATEELLKILVIGESAVGKSCLLLRYTDNKFQESFMSTIGVDFKTKYIAIEGTPVKLQIWDTAGQEKFRSITRAYYRGAHGILVVFDISRRDTFNQTKMWIDSIRDSQAEASSIDVILIGNKCDLVRAVTKEEAEELAKSYGIQYFETSAKQNTNVEQAFETLAGLALKRRLQSGGRGKGTTNTEGRGRVKVEVGKGKNSGEVGGCKC